MFVSGRLESHAAAKIIRDILSCLLKRWYCRGVLQAKISAPWMVNYKTGELLPIIQSIPLYNYHICWRPLIFWDYQSVNFYWDPLAAPFTRIFSLYLLSKRPIVAYGILRAAAWSYQLFLAYPSIKYKKLSKKEKLRKGSSSSSFRWSSSGGEFNGEWR